jgi:hypothetical protein
VIPLDQTLGGSWHPGKKEGRNMNLPKRDIIATVLVAASGLLYLLWLADATLPGLGSTRATGVVILALGFAASASAVVPGFHQLLHGNKVYLAVTCLIGLVAAIAGVLMLINGSGAALSIVMTAMVVLWLIATIHHSLLAAVSPREQLPVAEVKQRQLNAR